MGIPSPHPRVSGAPGDGTQPVLILSVCLLGLLSLLLLPLQTLLLLVLVWKLPLLLLLRVLLTSLVWSGVPRVIAPDVAAAGAMVVFPNVVAAPNAGVAVYGSIAGLIA